MLTIRQNIFETNSSSTHCFAYNLADKISKKQKNESLKVLNQYIKDGLLIVNGISDNSFKDMQCSFVGIYEKIQIVATEFVANDDQKLLNIFEKVIKEQCPEIEQIVYNIVFSGTNRNAWYYPYSIKTNCKLPHSDIYLENDNETLYEQFIKNPEILKLFLFGDSKLQCEEFATW